MTFADVLHFNCNNKPLTNANKIDLVTIAFNNELVIFHQIRLLKKNLLDPHYFTVADNSSDPEKQNTIMQICKDSGTAYIRLPENSFSATASSMSHGTALNWVWENYIKPRKAKYFGFLDHDMMPVKPTKVSGFLQDYYVYGLIQERRDSWYLWPGFCFYQYDYVKDKKLDFRPGGVDRDTGGENWEPLYSHLDKSKIPPLKKEILFFSYPVGVIYYEDWLHTYNASNWSGTEPHKNEQLKVLLKSY